MHKHEIPTPMTDIFTARKLDDGQGVLEMDKGDEVFRTEDAVVAFFYAETLNRILRHAALVNRQ